MSAVSELDALVTLFSERTGISPRCWPPDRLRDRVQREMARSGLRSLASYRDAVARTPALFDDLVDTLTVQETYFFRHPEQLDFIATSVLSDVHKRRGAHHTLNVWSAGCSSGEEAYSLAMLLGPCAVLGTDISRGALIKARAARYPAWSAKRIQHPLSEIHLRKDGEAYIVSPEVRKRVELLQHNLVTRAPGSDYDLILCRNTLIYLAPDAVAAFARAAFDALAEGGWLLTGPADPLLLDYAPFEKQLSAAGVHYRRRRQPAREKKPAKSSPVSTQTEAPPQPRASVTHEDTAMSLEAAARMAEREPLSAERHFQHASFLITAGDYPAALEALRRVLYVDGSLAVAHYTLGTLLRRLGDREGASRSFSNARLLCLQWPPSTPLPLTENDESAERLARATERQLNELEAK